MEEDQKSSMMKAVDYAYEKAINGVGVIESAYVLAEDYKSKFKDGEEAIRSLIRWQIAKCATSGFLTGIGGALLMPVAIPANISSVLFVQLRMIAAIAIMRGYDVNSDQVKTLAYACLTGSASAEIFKQVGIKVGRKLTESAINNISRTMLGQINKAVGFKLVTKFSSKGVLNFGKMIPVLGGVIGGSFDAFSTRVIGDIAMEVFVELGDS